MNENKFDGDKEIKQDKEKDVIEKDDKSSTKNNSDWGKNISNENNKFYQK